MGSFELTAIFSMCMRSIKYYLVKCHVTYLIITKLNWVVSASSFGSIFLQLSSLTGGVSDVWATMMPWYDIGNGTAGTCHGYDRDTDLTYKRWVLDTIQHDMLAISKHLVIIGEPIWAQEQFLSAWPSEFLICGAMWELSRALLWAHSPMVCGKGIYSRRIAGKI